MNALATPWSMLRAQWVSIALRMRQRFLDWLNGVPDYRRVAIRLRRWTPAPPTDLPRAVTVIERDATPEQIALSMDGMRSLANGAEHLTLSASGELVLGCCSCGHAHRLSYEPMITDAAELVLNVFVRNDDVLSAKLRRDFDFPFKAIKKIGMHTIIGAR